MKFAIRHEIKGRMRIHLSQKRMTCEQADTFLYFLENLKMVTSAKVYEQTADAAIFYSGSREELIEKIRGFSYEKTEVPAEVLQNSGRQLNAYYKEKLIMMVVWRGFKQLFVPQPIRTALTVIKSVKYIWKGIKTLMQRKLEVPVLDATAIAVSILRGDTGTAGSVMFLLGIGELLEEWTHKKSVGDLARTMALNTGKVWMKQGNQEILVNAETIVPGDEVIIRMGTVIPFDGVVTDGEAMVNQASLTGESVPVRRIRENYVYAGTVVEEGAVCIQVKQVGGSSRYEKIAAMIEESEKLKSNLESKAEHLADQLVPYSLGGTILTWLLTRNVAKALSILMVDFSCALKLAMPISVLSAIREASGYKITVKGGKYLEAVAEADTIVFDKTGTLTKAKPTVAGIIPFNGVEEDELLRMAACMEEHFPHSMAKAVVNAAKARNLDHEEMHSRVEYIVAHGISTTIGQKRAVIGSYHFVFEDEKCVIPEGKEELFSSLPEEYSHLYMALEGKLVAVICIEDPLREEAAAVIKELKEAGSAKIVMMTGDSDRTAKAIAAKVGVDAYYSEVLPEDKACFIEEQKAEGHRVIMVGDGINDSPALSAADVGIAVSEGAELAREIADITIAADDLRGLLTLKELSDGLMKRIQGNYRFIVGFNAGLILLGVLGILPPTISAMLHNGSTLLTGLKSMNNLLPEHSAKIQSAE